MLRAKLFSNELNKLVEGEQTTRRKGQLTLELPRCVDEFRRP
jgi:hypothetical protein